MDKVMRLESKIESLLFFHGKPVEVSVLSRILDISKHDVRVALKNLSKELDSRGISLVFTDKEAGLATSQEASELIESLRKDELARPLGKASMEVLAIVLYQGPVAKPRIDYIRGVNSSSTLRNLLLRGLIEQRKNPKRARSYVYVPTIDLLRYLGIGSKEESPHFEEYRGKLKSIKQEKSEETTENAPFQNEE